MSDDGSDRFKAADALSYQEVIEPFDRFTHRFSQPLAERLVTLADCAGHQKILDVGTGTGIVALQAARTLKSGAVLGLDLSPRMLAQARANAVAAGLADRVDFQQGDAEAMQLPDGAFDAVISLFALMHFPNPERALAEIYRVLRRGGKMVLGVGRGPELFSKKGILHRLGRLRELPLRLTGRYLTAPKTLDNLVRQRLPGSGVSEESALARKGKYFAPMLLRLVRAAGFEVLGTDWLGFAPSLDTPEEFWELQSTYSSFSRKRLSEATSEEVKQLRDKFLQACRVVQSRGGKLVYHYGAYFVIARRAN